MIDLTKKILPDSVEVSGRTHKIKTDFRDWLVFGQMARENCLYRDFDIFYILRPDLTPDAPEDRKAGFEELAKFHNPPQPLPRASGSEASVPVVDFMQDGDLVLAAFRDCYGINLKKEDMHWHEFLALFRGLHDTKLNEVMGFRSYDENDKTSYEDSMKALRDAWALEVPRTEEEMKTAEEFERSFG